MPILLTFCTSPNMKDGKYVTQSSIRWKNFGNHCRRLNVSRFETRLNCEYTPKCPKNLRTVDWSFCLKQSNANRFINAYHSRRVRGKLKIKFVRYILSLTFRKRRKEKVKISKRLQSVKNVTLPWPVGLFKDWRYLCTR